MNKLGIKIVYYPLAEAIHYRGKSADSHPFKVIYEFHTSMIKYYIKHQSNHRSWRVLRFLVVISIKIKKYLAYFNLLIKRNFNYNE